LDEIKGSEMNVWVADIAPGAATGKGCVLKIVKATFSAGHTVLDSSSDDQLCRYSTTVDMPRRASIKR
jgi:hypothetical protein